MSSKTQDGVKVTAHQRADEGTPVWAVMTQITTGKSGELILSSSVGKDSGRCVHVSISLDEILAWLPEMTDQARKFAVDNAERKLRFELAPNKGRRLATPARSPSPRSSGA